MKQLPENAKEVMVRRYSLRNEKGEYVETPKDILRRAARVVAQAEHNFRDGLTPDQVENEFLNLLTGMRMLPNGRTLANAGTGSGQLANCFVLPLEDDLGKTEEGIFSILRKAVLVLQAGGGVGFSFGRIRPKGDSAGRGKATGAVSFLKVFDTAFWVIGQGGGRRSACMAVLPVNHPDIFDFIRCKEKEGVIEHFNISVGVTNEFMTAVEKNRDFNLVNPRDGKVWQTVKARDLFGEIVKHAHHNGEPGILFIDRANADNPVPKQYRLEATNPCGEQWLGPFENCCMASINLAEHTINNEEILRQSGIRQNSRSAQDDKADLKSLSALSRNKSKVKLFESGVDWDKLGETVKWTVRWLDDVVEANLYVPAVPQLKEAAHKNRRIGVSVMGLADLMYKVGVRYGSDKAVDLAGQLMEFVRYQAMKASIELARERGAFAGIQGSIYDYSQTQNSKLKIQNWRIPKPIGEYKHRFDRPELDWNILKKDLKKYGIRNSAQTTIQPTGAIATIAGVEGYGCEPVFALSYLMKTREGAQEKGDGNWRELYYESRLFAEALNRSGLTDKEKKAVFEIVRQKGTCQEVELVPEEVREVFVVSSDVKVEEHVKMQAAMQAFTDNAISKTINFPAGSKVEAIEAAYVKGWKLGLKGMTVYVTGSRETVVLETKETSDKRQETSDKYKKEPFAVNGNGYVGKPLTKVKPEEMLCPECSAKMVIAEGCVTCPACAYTHCTI